MPTGVKLLFTGFAALVFVGVLWICAPDNSVAVQLTCFVCFFFGKTGSLRKHMKLTVAAYLLTMVAAIWLVV